MWRPDAVAPALQTSQVEARPVRQLRDLAVDDRPTVFLLDAESRSTFPVDMLRSFVEKHSDGEKRKRTLRQETEPINK